MTVTETEQPEAKGTKIAKIALIISITVLTSFAGAASDYQLSTDTEWNKGTTENTTVQNGNLFLQKEKIIDNFNDNSLNPKWLTTDQDQDSGTSFDETNEQLEIFAGGADIWTDDDEYGAVYREDISGDWTTTLTVTYQQDNVNDWAKSGIAVKNDMTASASATGYAVITATPGNGVSFQYDSNGDGYLDSNQEACTSYTEPVKVRMVKDGNQLTGLCSTDGGDTWTTVNSASPSGIQSIQDVGIISTSHSSGELVEARFDDWNLTKTTYHDSARYSSEIINSGSSQIQSWNSLDVDTTSIPTDMDLDATLKALDSSDNIVDRQVIDLTEGNNNYNVKLDASARAKIEFNSSSTDLQTPWRINSANLNYQPGMEIDGELSAENSSTGHSFDISAFATHSGGDDKVSNCEVYYRPKGLGWSKATDVTPTTTFGDSDQASCNSTIDTGLEGVGYEKQGVLTPSDVVDFRIKFEGENGITVNTDNKTNTLPNNEPVIDSVDEEISSNSHSVTFTSEASDQDGEGDFETCSIVAEDTDGNTETLNPSINYGATDNQVSCSDEIDDSIGGFEVGESITVFSRFTDITGTEVESTSTTFEIPNNPPTFAQIDSNPSSDSHDFSVTADFNPGDSIEDLTNGHCTAYISDGDGNSITRTITPVDTGTAECTFNDIGSQISGFKVNEEINTKVEITDEYRAKVNSTIQSETIPNRVPSAPSGVTLDVGDSNNVVDHQFSINWNNPSDDEGDDIEIQAYVGTSSDPSNLDNTLNKSEGSSMNLGQNVELLDGETYNLELKACDPYGCSPRTTAKSFTMNQEPSINNAGSSEPPNELTGTSSTDIFADITDSTNTVEWAEFTVWDESSGTKKINEENISSSTSGDYWNSSDFDVVEDTSYNWTVIAGDGFETNSLTGSFTTSEATPEIVKGLQFSDSETSHSFDLWTVARDDDGWDDITTATLHISDGETSKEYSADIQQIDSKKVNITYNGIDNSIEGFEVGESLNIYMEISDGSSTISTPTESHSIPNKAPSVSNIQITPTSPETDERLNVTYDLSDPEGDNISANYEWKVVGESSIITSRTVEPDSTSEGEEWEVSVQAEDIYGKTSSYKLVDTTETIQNSAPYISEQATVENNSDHKFTVSAVAADINSDSDIISCTFTVSDSNSNSAQETPAPNTGYGNASEVKCTQTFDPDDYWMEPLEDINIGVDFSDDNSETATTSVSNTVPNEVPNIDLYRPIDKNLTQDAVSLFWNASDADGDTLEYDLDIYDQDGRVVNDDSIASKSISKTLSDGEYTWNITARDLYTSNTVSDNISETESFLVDITSPSKSSNGLNISNSTETTLEQNDNVTIYSKWSDNFYMDKVVIYDSQTDTNKTVNLENGDWANKTIKAENISAGTLDYTVYAFDHLGNLEKYSDSVSVEDIEPPVISGFSVDPNSQANFDPDNPIDVNASAVDNVGVTNVDLQYRKNTSNTWNAKDMTKDLGKYQGSFTPTEEATYEFRVLAEDSAGNQKTVNRTQLVAVDSNWFVTPLSIGSSKRSTLESNSIEFRDIVIENNGDTDIDYSISVADKGSDNLNIDFNTSSVTVAPGEKEGIKATASLNDNDLSNGLTSTFNLNLTSSKTNSGDPVPEPGYDEISGLARFIQDGPFLQISEGVSFPGAVTQEDEDVVFSTKIENIGTKYSNLTEVEYSFPEEWTVSRNSYSIGNISAGSSKTNRTVVDIPANASTGTKTVFVEAVEKERSFNETFEVEVVEKAENNTRVIEEDGGGGFAGGGGSGPTSSEQVEQRSDQIFNTSESFEIVRGQDQNFTVRFQNPTSFNLTNITANVEGIQSQYLRLANPDLGRVNINESKNITVQITAPEYFQTGDYDLNFNITGKGIDGEGPYADYFGFTLNKDISLGVRAIPKDNASELLNQSEQLIQDMRNENLSTADLQSLVSEAENNLESGDYASVRENYEELQSSYQTAQDTRDGLRELEKQIKSAEASGLSVGRTRQIASLAEAALDRGAYTTAADRLEEAESTYQLQTAGEVNWVYEIRSNWKKILAAIIIFSIVAFAAKLRYRLYKIRKRLRDLESEEKSIEDLKIQKQKKAFEEKDISLSEYEDSVDDYNEQIVQIIEERVELETEKANITNFKRRDSLAQERDQLRNLIEETQRDYLEGNISDDEIYQEKVQELTERLSEIEGEIAEIDAKAQVRSQSLAGRIMEKIPLVSSGGKTE